MFCNETYQIPLQISTHLPLHLVHLLQGEHLLRNDTPAGIRVGVVTDDLGSDHEGGDEEPVTGRSLGGGVSGLEALEEEETGEGDEVGETGSVKGILKWTER